MNKKEKKTKSIIETVDVLISFLPVSWILACYNGAWEHLKNGETIYFLLIQLACFVITAFLCLISTENIAQIKVEHTGEKPKFARLACVIAALFIFTSIID